MTDSPAFRPLHSADAIRFGKRNETSTYADRFRSVSSARKLPRQSGTARAPPRVKEARGRDAPHIGQDPAIAVSADNFRCAPMANCPPSLRKPNWSDTLTPGFARDCRSRPFTLASQPSRSALPFKESAQISARARATRAPETSGGRLRNLLRIAFPHTDQKR